MQNSTTLRIATTVLALIVCAVTWAAVANNEPRITRPAVEIRSPDDRRATLAAFKEAWANRPREFSADNARAEKDFINQTAVLVDRTFRKEIGRDAYTFYQQTVSDFFSRYGSEDILAKR